MWSVSETDSGGTPNRRLPFDAAPSYADDKAMPTGVTRLRHLDHPNTPEDTMPHPLPDSRRSFLISMAAASAAPDIHHNRPGR